MRVLNKITVPVNKIKDSAEVYNLMMKVREYLYWSLIYNNDSFAMLTSYDLAVVDKYGIPVKIMFRNIRDIINAFYNVTGVEELLSLKFDKPCKDYKYITKYIAYSVNNNESYPVITIYFLTNKEKPEDSEPENERPWVSSTEEANKKLEKLMVKVPSRFSKVFKSMVDDIKKDPITALCKRYDTPISLRYDAPGDKYGTYYDFVANYKFERKLFKMFVESLPDVVTFNDRVEAFSGAIKILRKFVYETYFILEPVLRSKDLQSLGVMSKINYQQSAYLPGIEDTLYNTYTAVKLLSMFTSPSASMFNKSAIAASVTVMDKVDYKLTRVTGYMLEYAVDDLNKLLMDTLQRYAD